MSGTERTASALSKVRIIIDLMGAAPRCCRMQTHPRNVFMTILQIQLK